MAKGIKLIGKSTDALTAFLGIAEETDGLSVISRVRWGCVSHQLKVWNCYGT